ncbi:MAG: hypothetical protein QOD13_1137 [Thermoleophilaceae bacterium]|nr:hypothetical protein [Thermoleophilaceae bacterium]
MRRLAASLPLAAVLLNVTALAVLVPDIRLALGSSSSGGQWVLNAYLLGLAAPLPLFAALAGRTSVRTLAAGGALTMAVGAVVGARAHSTAVLVAGEALQGAGAAAVLACVAPMLAGARRGILAIAVLPAVALALGPFVGGVFAEQNWWRVFLWAGVPLAAVAGLAAVTGLATLASAPAPRRATAPAGALAFAAGLTAATIALVQSHVWSSGWCLLLLLAGALLLRGGLRPQARGAAVAWALAGCLAGLLFLIPQYFQLARNLSGLRSGTLLLAVTLTAVTAWTLSRWLAGRVPAVALSAAGLACAGIALAALFTIAPDTRYALLIGLLGLVGTGLGAAAGAAVAMEADESPLGLLAPALTGATLGLAAAGAAFQSGQADDRAGGGSFEQALAAGVGWAALVMLALVVIAAAVVWLPRRRAGAPA